MRAGTVGHDEAIECPMCCGEGTFAFDEVMDPELLRAIYRIRPDWNGEEMECPNCGGDGEM